MIITARNMLASACLVLASSCSTIAGFDQQAYENATSLKVDSKNVMATATQSYSSQQTKVNALRTNLEKAYEYDIGRPLNQITIKQWDLLLDPKGDLLGGFLTEWKEEGTLKPGYVRSKQTQIGRGFDTIIGLESGKLKATDVQ